MVRENCRSYQPRLLKVALVYVLLGWTAELAAAAYVAVTGWPVPLWILIFAAFLAFTRTLCVRRRLAGFQKMSSEFTSISPEFQVAIMLLAFVLLPLYCSRSFRVAACHESGFLACTNAFPATQFHQPQWLAWFRQVDFRYIFALLVLSRPSQFRSESSS